MTVESDQLELPLDENTPADPAAPAEQEPPAPVEPAEADELVISLGDTPAEPEEADETAAPEWIRTLRKQNREKDRRIRELEQRVSAGAAPEPAAVVVGPKPTLEGCDYDAAKFETDLEAWHVRKREADEQAAKRARVEEEQRGKWQTRIDAVAKAAQAMPVRDYQEAAEEFESVFSPVQQGIIVGGPDDPKTSAQLRYALGKNPKKARELAAISDPVKFALAIGDLMTKLKVTTRKAAPVPETVIRSSVGGAAAVDSQLARLRAEAERTGDYTQVHQYRQQLRDKARA